MNKKGIIGGFVAENQGKINNCYSTVAVKAAKSTSGGFAGMDNGSTAYCFSYGSIQKVKGGFAASGARADSSNYCFCTEHLSDKENAKVADAFLLHEAQEVRSSEDLEHFALDTAAVFVYDGKSRFPIHFNEERWIYDTALSPKLSPGGAQSPMMISTAEELERFAQGVNKGDPQYRDGYFTLSCDINLHGREWSPIGIDKAHAFRGVFDGCGYTVSGLCVKKTGAFRGLFGCLAGEIYNLSVEGSLSGGEYAGGIAAMNQGGLIAACSAAVDIAAGMGCTGGLVASNTGMIQLSCAAGTITEGSSRFIPILLWVNGVLLLLAAVVLFVLPMFDINVIQVFAPVPYDNDSVPIQTDEGEDLTPVTENNFVSFQFKEKIDVNLTTGACTFEFKNPGNSNHNTVVQLQFTDAQAKRLIGTTGRTAEEQATLEATEGYDPENYRTVLAESGAIRPGYQLENLTLESFVTQSNMAAGSYNAMVYLIYYDMNTNARAMLETQLPVVIDVHR